MIAVRPGIGFIVAGHDGGAMVVGQDWRFILLSYVVAVVAAFTALELTRPAAEARRPRGAVGWAFAGTTALAIGVWSMHFVGMQAFRIAVPVAYDVSLVVASFAVALGGAVVALWLVVYGKATSGIVAGASVLLGLCLAGMHYTGMAALRIAAVVRYDPRWVAVSVAIAIVTSYAAFLLIARFTKERRLRHLGPEALVAGVLGIAIVSVHYTGMAAARFSASAPPASGGVLVNQQAVAVIVGVATLSVLGLFLLSARVNVRSRRRAIEHERYRALAESVPNIVWTTNGDGVVEYSNRRFLEYAGLSADALAERGWEAVIHPSDRANALAAWHTALASGASYRADARLRRADGEYRWHVMLAVPVREGGTIAKWFGSSTDIEDQKDAERIMSLLGDVTQALTSSLDDAGIARSLADLVAPSEAAYCEVQLYDGARLLQTVAAAGDAAAHTPDRAQRAERTRRVGAALLTREISVVPVRGTDRVLGWLVCCDVVDDVRALVPELASRLGAALVNANAYAREHRVAASFQTAALVSDLPEVPGVSFSALYQAADAEASVGGDWYDAFRLPDGRVVFSVGDVAGSGLDAAVTMSSVRQSIRTAALINPDPGAVLDAVDRIVRAMGNGRFVTAFVGVLDPVCEEFAYANAGHPPPLLRRPGGAIAELGQGDLPLGLRQRNSSGRTILNIERGSLIVAYTDGLTELHRDPLAGEANLVSALRTSEGDDVAGQIFRALSGGNPARDDIAILAVRFDAGLVDADARSARRWSFDVRDGERAAAARHEFLTFLESAGFAGATLNAAELVFGELVGNVYRYALGHAVVIVDVSGAAAVLHVLDDGEGFELNPRLPADLYSERGRGLFLVNAFADEFSIERRRTGGSHARAVLVGTTRVRALSTMTRTAL
jgi:PAS domain S-box-containing protein